MKRMFVKALSLCLSAAVLVIASACSGGAGENAASAAGSAGSASAGGKTDLKVGFVTSASGQNDNGYNRSAVEAIKTAADEYGFEYRVVEPSSSLTVGQAIEALAEEGYGLIFNLEYDFAALIDGTGAAGNVPIAEKYPDTTFVIYNDNPNVNEDGSVKYDNVYSCMFNVNEASYLAGYLADKYDVDAEQSIPRANARIRKSTEDAFAATVNGYTTVTKEDGSIRLRDGNVTYAFFPVWLLNTTWNGQNYLFAMNGQSGKMVGDLPLDKAAYRKWLFGLTGVIGMAVFAISYLLWLL